MMSEKKLVERIGSIVRIVVEPKEREVEKSLQTIFQAEDKIVKVCDMCAHVHICLWRLCFSFTISAHYLQTLRLTPATT